MRCNLILLDGKPLDDIPVLGRPEIPCELVMKAGPALHNQSRD